MPTCGGSGPLPGVTLGVQPLAVVQEMAMLQESVQPSKLLWFPTASSHASPCWPLPGAGALPSPQ